MTEMLSLDILLVEDNPNDVEMTVRALKKHNIAHRLMILENGAEALDFIFCRGVYHRREIAMRPYVILLDIKLPKVDGLEVLRQIKSDTRTKSIPVVMVTSSREDPDVQNAFSSGANSYVVKPVQSDEFSEAIRQLGHYWLRINEPFSLRTKIASPQSGGSAAEG
jgi:two-component system, response regulator